MIAVDANILVYAHRGELTWHGSASRVVTELAESGRPWAIPWPCVHEFIAITTNPKVFKPASTFEQAKNQIEAWMDTPNFVFIGESRGYWDEFVEIAAKGRVVGGAVHDARIAAICLTHGVRELWTADRDFGRFPKLKTKNPLV